MKIVSNVSNASLSSVSPELARIIFRRLNAVPLVDSKESASKPVLAAWFSNLADLNYVFNENSVNNVTLATNVLEAILDEAKNLRGSHNYTPMYPNFPRQVAEASLFELYVNAILHYVGDGLNMRIMPFYEAIARPDLNEREWNAPDVIDVADANSVSLLARNIVSQGQPYSEQDKNDLLALRDFVEVTPVGVKENLVFLTVNFPELDWLPQYKDVTDVLRLAAGLSGGDISLAENTKFKLSRPQRRLIAGLLNTIIEESPFKADDFAFHREKWKRLAHAIHFNETCSPVVRAALGKVMADENFGLFSRIEEAYSKGSVGSVLDILMSRPGVFARNLARLIRVFPDDEKTIVNYFGTVAADVSTPVLVQLYNIFTAPEAGELPYRAIVSKGGSASVIPNRNKKNSAVVEVVEKALRSHRLPYKIVVDGNGDEFAVPLGVRSASKGKVIGRGSRIKLSDKNVVRMFMHWKDIDYDRVDLDLSAFLVKEDFSNDITISYYNLRDLGINAYHSGDITSAPDGAVEYIDIDAHTALKEGYRYVLMSIYNYTGQNINEVPEAYAGVMERENVNDGEIFEAKTVSAAFELSTSGKNSTPFLFDLKTREMIWLDLPMTSRSGLFNVANNESALAAAVRDYALSHKMTVGKLASLMSSDNKPELVIDPSRTEEVLQLLT